MGNKWVVAPRTGAWIETGSLPLRRIPSGSRPARARGLKHSMPMKSKD